MMQSKKREKFELKKSRYAFSFKGTAEKEEKTKHASSPPQERCRHEINQ